MCVLMTITVYGFYPETKGLGIEETPLVFQKHWCALTPCLSHIDDLSSHVSVAAQPLYCSGEM